MKIVLAYSGGLDTSVLLSWIKDTYNAEMIAFCANIGQEEELKGLEAKARRFALMRWSMGRWLCGDGTIASAVRVVVRARCEPSTMPCEDAELMVAPPQLR